MRVIAFALAAECALAAILEFDAGHYGWFACDVIAMIGALGVWVCLSERGPRI